MSEELISSQDLYRQYVPAVYRFAFYLCGDSDLAKDIISEWFIFVFAGKQVSLSLYIHAAVICWTGYGIIIKRRVSVTGL